MENWSIDQAKALYNTGHWSGGYFEINDAGNLAARPWRDKSSQSIDLYQLVQEIQQSGLSAPVLVRFSNILHDRIDHLVNAFQQAREQLRYSGAYTAVYPIKVNQEQSVVHEITAYGGNNVGLEAGSKPELMAVLALSKSNDSIIVCNGYKDREYIRMALIGRQLGHRIFIVLEKPSELELVIEESRDMGVKPLLGMRARMSSADNSKWQNTGGEKAKFGLSPAQILHVIQRLKNLGLDDCLQLLHFHLGSQIANSQDIHKGMIECARYYAELHRYGIRIRYVDVGGGLGIDYEGTRSRNYFSTNYNVHEYASIIVSTLQEMCMRQDLPHPHIITESGRAMTAHHAMLVINVIETEQRPVDEPTGNGLEDSHIITQLRKQIADLENDGSHAVECYQNATQILSDIQQQFNSGTVTLAEKAKADQIYYTLCHKALQRLNVNIKSHRGVVDEINEKMADKYFCNFSIFQSLPDIWAIDQIFPIAPLHRLNERPTRRAILQDITCDSDGRIDSYVDGEGIESSLPLHPLNKDEPYYLGVFLVGAYQEILGDLHNLFGDTNSVNVELTEDGYQLNEILHGDSVDYVLQYVHFDTDEFLTSYRNKLKAAELSPEDYDNYLTELKAGLMGYTYLED